MCCLPSAVCAISWDLNSLGPGGEEELQGKRYFGIPRDGFKAESIERFEKDLPDTGTKRTATFTNDLGLRVTSLWSTTKGRAQSPMYTVT